MRNKRFYRPAFEELEDRCVPAVWGTPWPDSQHLTLSFAPDGTQVVDQESRLFETLNAQTSSAVWQREILQAYQTWAVHANLNISVVSDDGSPFGVSGALQSDSRFGDIRIGAIPMESELAEAQAFSWIAGTWSGDVLLNTVPPIDYDLFAVMLHEAGHSLGLEHSSDPASVMNQHYEPELSSLSLSDIAAIQSLYGARSLDRNEVSSGGSAWASMNDLGISPSGSGSDRFRLARGDIATLDDSDLFKFKTSKTAGPITFNLQTSGISSLVSRITVYDSAKKAVATATATDPMHGDLSVRLTSLAKNKIYYVMVESAAADVFGIGSYQLSLRPDSVSDQELPDAITYQVTNGFVSYEDHTNDTSGQATILYDEIAPGGAGFDSFYQGSFHDGGDVDFYSIRPPKAAGKKTTVMAVTLWATEGDGLDPLVRVYDSQQTLVSGAVLRHQGGSYVLEVPGVATNGTYYLEVYAGSSPTGQNVGNYFLGVGFSAQVTKIETAATGTLTNTQTWGSTAFNVASASLFHFLLSANASPVESGVRMGIVDENDMVVFTTAALAGQIVSADVFLQAGSYRIFYEAGTRNGEPLSPLSFNLSYVNLGSNIDPYLIEANSPSPSHTVYDETGIALIEIYGLPYWY